MRGKDEKGTPGCSGMGVQASLDRFFEITRRGSTVPTEIKGGVLIFLSMVYIIAVNTGMMVDAGMDRSACYTATIAMAIVGSLIMGLYAKYPVAQAPLMGVNAFFAYTIAGVMGFTWQEALVAVLISGIIFFVIAVTGVRKRVLDQIPPSLRYGITAGIGCFIVFIGLSNAGIIANSDSTLVTLGDFSDYSVILAFFCVLLTLFLYAKRFPGAVFIGMVVTAILGLAVGTIPVPEDLVSMPAMPPVGAFLDGISSDLLSIDFLVAVISLAFVQFFDSTGTLMATGERAGILDEEGNVKCDRALNADSATSVISGLVGATPTGSFAESTVGIEAGARTGLAAVTVALLFAVALFVGPAFSVVDYTCTVGAMVIVGAAMITQLKGVKWDDWPVAVAVMATVVIMILTYSITDGIVFGILFYCVCMIGARRWREVSPVIYGLAVLFVLYLVFVVGSLRGPSPFYPQGGWAVRVRHTRQIRGDRPEERAGQAQVREPAPRERRQHAYGGRRGGHRREAGRQALRGGGGPGEGRRIPQARLRDRVGLRDGGHVLQDGGHLRACRRVLAA